MESCITYTTECISFHKRWETLTSYVTLPLNPIKQELCSNQNIADTFHVSLDSGCRWSDKLYQEGKKFQKIFTNDVDIIHDYENRKLIINLYSLSPPRANLAVKELCVLLKQTETYYPYTNLLLVYETVSA